MHEALFVLPIYCHLLWVNEFSWHCESCHLDWVFMNRMINWHPHVHLLTPLLNKWHRHVCCILCINDMLMTLKAAPLIIYLNCDTKRIPITLGDNLITFLHSNRLSCILLLGLVVVELALSSLRSSHWLGVLEVRPTSYHRCIVDLSFLQLLESLTLCECLLELFYIGE